MTIFFFWLITDSLWENRKHFFIRLFFTITSAFVQFFLPLTYTKWLQANFSQHHSWNRAINSIRISFYSTCSSKLFFSSSISVHVFTVNFTPYNGQASQWTITHCDEPQTIRHALIATDMMKKYGNLYQY